jgi:hypothetical protein
MTTTQIERETRERTLAERYRRIRDRTEAHALPLGWHISRFAPEHSCCHFCPELPQTLQHFVFSCPLARVVWQEFRLLFHLSLPVTLQQAAFSWSCNMVTSGQHVGFQLQAGHAIALHVLWKLHTAARYGNHPPLWPALGPLSVLTSCCT